ncbi:MULTISPECIES: hypothetical protein [unclassified Streptomyces]|uniref:hypothetical protein n=1 Tax=unclassified Streptomyces TaxID=2593676 RepID=UPI000AA5479B
MVIGDQDPMLARLAQVVRRQISVPRTGVGRFRTRPDHVLAYTSRSNRRYL